MGYYIRVLGTSNPDIHLDELLNNLQAEGLSAKFALAEDEKPNNWTLIEVSNNDDEVLAQIERNSIIKGELGYNELEEFKEEIQESKPTSAVKWLTDYFEKVKVIYAFQMLNAAFDNGNFEIIASIKTKIWNQTNGILQADNEGFSNENGHHILWQFSDKVTGDWSCAVLNSSNDWENFVMDLGDKKQRQEFQDGKVPQNAKRIY